MSDEAWTTGGTAVADEDCDLDGDGTGDPTSRLTGVGTLKPDATYPFTVEGGDYLITKYLYDNAGRQNGVITPDPDGDALRWTIATTAYDLASLSLSKSPSGEEE